MRDLYGDEYESVAGSNSGNPRPGAIQRLAGAAVFIGLILAMGVWSYRLGTRDASQVPIIRAMEGPARVKPDDPGGLQAAHQGLEVNAVLAGEPAPQPREPVALVPEPAVLTEEDAPQGELVLAEPSPLSEVAIDGDADLRMPLQEDAPETVAAVTSPGATPPETAAADPELTAPAAGLDPGLTGVAAELPDASGAAPAARPKGRPANLAVVRAPAVASKAESPSAAAARSPSAGEVAGLQRGTRLVQLGAFDNEGVTRAAWDKLVARNGDLLGSKSLYIERTTANARVFYRLRVAGFDNTEETRAMCEALKARSVDCIPVTLQ